MVDLHSYLAVKRKRVDDTLKRIFERPTDSKRIKAAMLHSIMAGGKRLRPILCLSTIEALAGNPDSETALNVACALEMIHTYSLIHDDLPAMDNDELRRGKPTCHIAFDESTAILAGDALLTLAFETLAQTEASNVVSASRLLRIIRLIAAAAGHQGMVAGQMLDISSEGTPLPLDMLRYMYRLKTGALIGAAVRVGAIMANASDRQFNLLGTYADYIGLAFQITDDILNVQGDPAVMGKSIGTDEIRRKNTYPSIAGIKAAKKQTQELLTKALQVLEAFDNKSDPLREIATFVMKRNS